MAKVIIINGYPGSGKDQFIKFCQEIDPTIKNIHTSDKAKEALTLLGWNGEKDGWIRSVLANMMRTSETFDGVFKYVAEEIRMAAAEQLVFVHIREWDNVVRYKKAFGALTLFIDRLVDEHEHHSNSSDMFAAQNINEYDWLIPNHFNLGRLKDQAIGFIASVKSGFQGGIIC